MLQEILKQKQTSNPCAEHKFKCHVSLNIKVAGNLTAAPRPVDVENNSPCAAVHIFKCHVSLNMEGCT